jgi:hypothetical protein
MAVELIKTGAHIQDGLIVYPNKIVCDHCDITYELHYSKGEEHRLNARLLKAKPVVSQSQVSTRILSPFLSDKNSSLIVSGL